jgi:uncharacterized membrane protein YfcA
VIATSSGAAAAYVRDRMTDMRIGMFLELATTTGAMAGALLAAIVAPAALLVLLGIVLLGSAAQQILRLGEELPPDIEVTGLAARLGLSGSYPDARLGRNVPYAAQRVPLGFALMGFAGLVSGLLGIGSGALKVLASDCRRVSRDLPWSRQCRSADCSARRPRSPRRVDDRRPAPAPPLEPRCPIDLPAGPRRDRS